MRGGELGELLVCRQALRGIVHMARDLAVARKGAWKGRGSGAGHLCQLGLACASSSAVRIIAVHHAASASCAGPQYMPVATFFVVVGP